MKKIILLSTLFFGGCKEKTLVPQKPFYIINKVCTSVIYCHYYYVDSLGNQFEMDDADDKYFVGQKIK